MPLKVRRLPQAADDMFEIWAAVAAHNARAADRLIDRFYDAEEVLGRNPEIGEARPEIAPDFRKWTVAPYVMFYRVTADAVEVVRVLHGARDFEAVFDAWAE